MTDNPAAAQQFAAAVSLGDSLAQQGDVAAALRAYERAQILIPGRSLPFTRAACLRLSSLFGSSSTAGAASPATPRVQMSSLGTNGRFGNQLLQYAFLRLYAARHGLVAETPEWIGQHVYGCAEPRVSRALPAIDEHDLDWYAALRGEMTAAPRNCDLRGYFCEDTRRWGGAAADFRALFQPVRRARALLDAALARARTHRGTLVAVHVRRGDFGYGRFWSASVRWYLRWLRDLWPSLAQPVLYVASDEPDIAGAFAEFSPLGHADLAAGLDGLEFLCDHFVLSRADHLAISNSSFSFTAAMLNPALRSAVRPHPDRRELVAFDPWAAPVLLDPGIGGGTANGDGSSGAFCADRAGVAPRQCVVHYGGYCSDWTHAVRRQLPVVRVHELDTGESLDDWCARRSLDVVDHLCIADAASVDELLVQARAAFAAMKIRSVHFAVTRTDAQELVMRLGELGFQVDAAGTHGAMRRMQHAAAAKDAATTATAVSAARPASGSFAGRIGMGGLHPDERPQFLIASLYTPSYRAQAERLAGSLRALGLPFTLYEVPSVHRSISTLHGTDDLTYSKPHFVQFLLERHRVPILYLDCDCVLRADPRLIPSLIDSRCEFAIYNWLADPHTDAYMPVELRGADGRPVEPAARFFRFAYSVDAFLPSELLCSGAVQFYADAAETRELLRAWSGVIAAHPGVNDDPCLDVAFNFRMPERDRPRFVWLDKAYARYLFWIYARPVIDHPQMPAMGQAPAAPHVPLPKGPRFHAEHAETRVDARWLPRDCIVDTLGKRVLRPQPSRARPAEMETVDVGPLLHELFLDAPIASRNPLPGRTS